MGTTWRFCILCGRSLQKQCWADEDVQVRPNSSCIHYSTNMFLLLHFSLSGGPKKAEKYSFSDHPDFDESLTKGPFSSWAADVLSCKHVFTIGIFRDLMLSTGQSRSHTRKGKEKAVDLGLSLQFDSSGLPSLPDMDSPEELPIDVVRRLLISYTTASWSASTSQYSEDCANGISQNVN